MQKNTYRASSLVRLIVPAALALSHIARADDAQNSAAPPGVSIPDSPGAIERLDKAREKENQKQWKTAAEFYQEVLSKYPGRVVPASIDADNKIYRYIGIAPTVQQRIAKWPAAGLAIYRTAYGATAADRLNAVPRGNIAGLEAVYWNYFVTDAGKTAGMRLIDANLENGDFTAAQQFGDQLLTLHPFLGVDRPAILYRTAIACHFAGDARKAADLLNQLKSQSPNELGSIGGKDVRLVDSLSAVLATDLAQPAKRPSDSDTYPSFGGLGGRGTISSSYARPGASLNSIQLTKPDLLSNGAQQATALQQSDDRTLTNRLAMGIMPVVDAGSLFFQDGRCVYAVDADTGAPLSGWLNTYGADRNGRYKLNVFGRVSGEPTTLTVTPGAVVAVMGQPDATSRLFTNPNGFVIPGQMAMVPSTVKLVCLDRSTGREMWTKSAAELPETAGSARTGSFSGTPLFIPANLTSYGEDSVIVIARGGSGNESQFDDCSAICLSLKTGQFKWSTYLGSAAHSYTMDGGAAVNPSQLSLADGRVFVMTNLGSVVSLDPADGKIFWFNAYPRDGMTNDGQVFLNGRPIGMNGGQLPVPPSDSAWAQNPVIVNEGNVFVLPRDVKQLFIYDALTGVQKNCLPMYAFDDARVLLAVRGPRLCLTSTKRVMLVNWTRYQDGDQKIATEVKKDVAIMDGTNGDLSGAESPVMGRGFATDEEIFIPTQYRLCAFSWRALRLMQFYPQKGVFTQDQGPGNMLVTARDVVVAGQTRVNVYTDLTLVRQRFETAMTAEPANPEPRLDYASALFASGDMEGAMARVDEAIDLLGGASALRSGKDRDHLFLVLLDFASRSETSRGRDDPKNVAWINQFYDRSAAAAQTPVQNAKYRLARAKFDHARHEYTAEIQLCQEILSDPAMRDAMVTEELSGGEAAESAIESAISIDRKSYAAIEDKAADALQSARQSNQPEPLLAVATEFPNSKAAIDAREDAVKRLEADNQPERAIAVLRRMYAAGNIDQNRKIDLLISVANDFLTMPDGVGPALDRLCRASRFGATMQMPGKLRLPDGSTLTNVTYLDAIKKLRQLQSDQDNARLPVFHLPDPRPRMLTPFSSSVPTIQNVASLVHPLNEFDNPGQILTWGENGLSIYPAMETTPVATIAQVDKAPLSSAWIRDRWIVWTSSDVYQLSGDGKLAWDLPIKSLPAMAVSTGSDSIIDDLKGDGTEGNVENEVNQLQIINGQVVRMNAARLRGGMRGFQQQVVAPPVAVARTAEEEVASVCPGGDRVVITTTWGRVLGVDLRSGHPVWQTRPLDHPVDQLLANPHFTVVRMDNPAGSQVAVYDTSTGRAIGRRRFGADSMPTQLVNLALSEEATLAITLYNQVFVKDLYDPWKLAPQPLVAKVRDVAPFSQMTQSDQLIARGGFVVCLYDGGKFAQSYDLRKNGESTQPLESGTITGGVKMRLIGTRLYIINPMAVLQHNLVDPTDFCVHTLGSQNTIYTMRDALLGRDYAILINQPTDRGVIGQPYIWLTAHGLAPLPGKTSEGDFPAWTDIPKLKDHAGIIDWIAAQGCVCYRTKDNVLHIMSGAK